MRPLRSLLIFIILVFLGGALLAPLLYWLVQSAAPSSRFGHYPFHRFLDCSMLALALLGIWPLLRSFGAKSLRDLGMVKPSAQWHRLGAGFLIGFSSLACAVTVVLLARHRAFNDALTAPELSRKLAGALATAIGVGVLEEILFRGAIFGALRKMWDWRPALLASSVIYAIAHFLTKADLPGPVTWSSGLRLLPLMFSGSGTWETIIPQLCNLTLAGILLGFAYQKTGNLYFSIGLHAGWIFWLKSYGIFTVPVAHAQPWLWGTEKLIDGWLALLILAVVLLVLLRLLPAKAEDRHK